VIRTLLGVWPIAGNTCEATLSVDRPWSIGISLKWSRDPGPSEKEHLDTVLPEIVGSAREAVRELAAIGEAIQGLIAEGKMCRIGIRDGLFVYALTNPDSPGPQHRDHQLPLAIIQRNVNGIVLHDRPPFACGSVPARNNPQLCNRSGRSFHMV
jgi:hypothetical protein